MNAKRSSKSRQNSNFLHQTCEVDVDTLNLPRNQNRKNCELTPRVNTKINICSIMGILNDGTCLLLNSI